MSNPKMERRAEKVGLGRLAAAMVCPRCKKMVSVIGGRLSPHKDRNDMRCTQVDPR